ncbi:MAG: nuclear transport factor 2 family protein [Planctomycetota bacterium]
MTKNLSRLLCFFTILTVAGSFGLADEPSETSQKTIAELNAYWKEVSRSVREGDFAGYAATCHPEGVLVSGSKKSSYPLSQALEGWKPGFEDTLAKRMEASVEFRFSQRLIGTQTAHETGIFRYATSRDGEEAVAFIHFEGLLKKTPKGWQILMEYQKSEATEAEWKTLAPIGNE